MNERIKQLREYLGITLEEFGRRIGITRSSVSNIESGRREPSEQTIRSICREFDVNENWLINGLGEVFLPKSESIMETFARKYDLNQMEYLILDEYLNLDYKQRQSILNFAINVFGKFNDTDVRLEGPAKVTLEEVADYNNFHEVADLSIEDKVNAYRDYLKSGKESTANQIFPA